LVGAASFDDDPNAGVCFALDLTERRKLEQQFLRAQRMESIGTLAGGIAHDLNNALTPILMSLDLLKRRFPDPDSLDLISLIGTSAQRGADMVRQLLSFARGVEGKRVPVPMAPMLREIEKIANETFLKHITVRTDLPATIWEVLGDPCQLHQILLNLAVNARDAMPAGGTLSLSAENAVLDSHSTGLPFEARPGPYLLIKVGDTGTGMPPDIIERIFDPFFTTKALGHGTGLGLSTTISIIRSHGGFIRVESAVGRGTVFHLHLPALTEPAGHSPAPANLTAMPRGNGELILVIDDEPLVREISSRTLENHGYQVLLAADGAEGIALFASRQSDIALVLTDMMMPVMDGPAAIAIIRRLHPGMPIIAASGLADQDRIARATTLGIQHFLPKPYTAESLLQLLQNILSPTPG
ncbi:MAG: sensory box protein, partial [Verrucomicrobiales bacterium]|nr:sensory box protein [Verrucomicrobiales bacterium]